MFMNLAYNKITMSVWLSNTLSFNILLYFH